MRKRDDMAALKRSAGLEDLLRSDSIPNKSDDLQAEKIRKMTFYLPETMAAKLDAVARIEGVSRSRFVADILSLHLLREEVEEAIDAIYHAKMVMKKTDT